MSPNQPRDSTQNKKPTSKDRWYPNPSFGLSLWGPLVPANDCKPCLAALATLQGLVGLSMWIVPRRQAGLGPRTFSQRLFRVGSWLGGAYLIFSSAMEGYRLLIPVDPWVEDARAARKRAAQEGVGQGLLAKYWFGPPGYRACSLDEWRHRVNRRFDQVDPEKLLHISNEFKHMESAIDDFRNHNRETGAHILDEIYSGSFKPSTLYDDIDIHVDEDLDPDDIEFYQIDVWARYRNLAPLSIAIFPRSPPLKVEGEQQSDRLTQMVSYAQVPVVLPKV